MCPWRRCVLPALLSLTMLVASVLLAQLVEPGRHAVLFVVKALSSGIAGHVVATVLGVASGVVLGSVTYLLAADAERSAFQRLVGSLTYAAVVAAFAALSVFVGRDRLQGLRAWAGGEVRSTSAAELLVPRGFVGDVYHACNFAPTQIAVGPEGHLYATGFSAIPEAAVLGRGLVMRLARDAATGTIRETKVADLYRPMGLAWYGDDLFVSHAGTFVEANRGELKHVPTGAVTLLRDLDGDGVADYFHDVLPGLPGVWAPGDLHQNNGIAFDAEGYLYATVGVHGDRSPPLTDEEGTIVRCRSDGTERSVFARGFRNPFDLAFGPGGALFSTDNDANDLGAGDELNHVVAGGHYGYPYADGLTEHPAGTIPPLRVTTEGSYEGLAWTDAEALPAGYRNSLYVVHYGADELLQVSLEAAGDTYRASATVFAKVPGALDVTIDPQGVFYVSSFHRRCIYRIRYVGEGP